MRPPLLLLLFQVIQKRARGVLGKSQALRTKASNDEQAAQKAAELKQQADEDARDEALMAEQKAADEATGGDGGGVETGAGAAAAAAAGEAGEVGSPSDATTVSAPDANAADANTTDAKTADSTIAPAPELASDVDAAVADSLEAVSTDKDGNGGGDSVVIPALLQSAAETHDTAADDSTAGGDSAEAVDTIAGDDGPAKAGPTDDKEENK